MSKAIVIYTSKRGSTKQYAEWIAEDLGCEAVPFEVLYMADGSEAAGSLILTSSAGCSTMN